jgi:hypothetical protein
MKGVHGLFKRLRAGRRPPTGPLTTSEESDAEELRQKTLAEDEERRQHRQAVTGPETDSGPSKPSSA